MSISVTTKLQAILVFFCFVVIVPVSHAEIPSKLTGVYLPPNHLSKRRLSEFIHYSRYTKMNAVVLHMKDPRGMIYWDSANPVAKEIGAVSDNHYIIRELPLLKSKGIWTIAKIDVFIDSRLAQHKPGYGVKNSHTGELWADYSGLNWTNPYDPCVWEYNINLARELVMEGFDEIQFDYIRFPSDGNLSRLNYPEKPEGLTMAKCIGRFLEKAHAELKPLGAVISVDLFGLTAWKTSDFGVGQVIEEMSPYVDIICPMFYPSHFPKGFLGFKNPSDHPKKIMYQSSIMMKKRTGKSIRPWVQGFWYSADKIFQQLSALEKAGISDWMVWQSSGDYKTTNRALLKDFPDVLPHPRFYPSVAELKHRKDKIVKGHTTRVNYTNYRKGYSVLSLEKPFGNLTRNYSTPTLAVHSLDEAILDLLLKKNNLPLNRRSGKYSKSIRIAGLLCRQINKNPREIKPQPIYVDWGGNGGFSLAVPPEVELPPNELPVSF